MEEAPKKYPRRLWKVKLNDPKSGGKRNSFVTDPAMEAPLVCLSKEEDGDEVVIHTLAIENTNDLQQTVTGVVLEPGKWIKRNDRKTGEIYEAMLSEQDVDNYAKNFTIDPMRLLDTNLQHKIPIKVDNLSVPRMFATWQVLDPNNDLSNAMGIGPKAKRTLLATYYIPSLELYSLIKEKKMGISVEAVFDEVPYEDLSATQLNKPNTMKLKNLFSFTKLSKPKTIQLMEFPLQNGKTLSIDDNTFLASINDEVAPDGDYVVTDGSIITVQDGQAIDITEPSQLKTQTQNMETLKKDAVNTATTPAIEIKDAVTQTNLGATITVTTTQVSEVETLKKQLEEVSAKLSSRF